MHPGNGKDVTVVMELQARLMKRQIYTGQPNFQEEGVKIITSAPGLKIHAKLLLIKRKEKSSYSYYANISNGNYNEETATTFSDFSLFTANKAIVEDVDKIFNLLESSYRPVRLKHLILSPYNTRSTIAKHIDKKKFRMQNWAKKPDDYKLDNLADSEVASKLYQAALQE